MTASTRSPVEEAREVQPVRTDVAHGPEDPALVRLEAPVPVRVVQQPVLEVAARDQADVADATLADERRDVLVERVEADVEVDRVDEAARVGQRDELRGLRRGHRQRLLADDVAARGQDLPDLRVVELVGRGDVDDLDRVVREHFVQAGVGLRQAELRRALRSELRRRLQQAATRTPIRRSASMCTVPINPLPMTAVPMSLRRAMGAAVLRQVSAGAAAAAAVPVSQPVYRLDGAPEERRSADVGPMVSGVGGGSDPPENDGDPIEDEPRAWRAAACRPARSAAARSSVTSCEALATESFPQARHPRRQQHVARGIRPAQVARHRDADHGSQGASS